MARQNKKTGDNNIDVFEKELAMKQQMQEEAKNKVTQPKTIPEFSNVEVTEVKDQNLEEQDDSIEDFFDVQNQLESISVLVFKHLQTNDKDFFKKEKFKIFNQVKLFLEGDNLPYEVIRTAFGIIGMLQYGSGVSIEKPNRNKNKESQIDHEKWRREILGYDKPKKEKKKQKNKGYSKSFF